MARIDISFEIKGENLVAIAISKSGDVLQFLKWNTLFDVPYVHGLEVKRNDVPLTYVGPHVKRKFDPAISIITIAPDVRYEFTFQLDEVLKNFDCDLISEADSVTIDIANRHFLPYPLIEEGLPPQSEKIIHSSAIEISFSLIKRYYKKKIQMSSFTSIQVSRACRFAFPDTAAALNNLDQRALILLGTQ